ncbi:WD40 repeat domain-containing protein [Lacinutrix venerupis]|uniref:Uncharacterized protein n=1 Tax=Lacinutrix venerupis TaxID=1486034 RepID=A0AAC9LK69_9FLAO|nr:hypothetical protein [Lacinutrix venerupis]APX98901.1 hypothetical protein BWR22_00795 [Lacinutrix venerupis]
MKKQTCFIFAFLSIIIAQSQIDLNRCKITQNQSFAVRTLLLTDSLFVQQSYNLSTLYVSKNDGSGTITILNGSPLGIKLVAVDSTQKYIAIVDYDKSVKIIEHNTKEVVKHFKIENSKITAITWYKNKLILGLEDGSNQIHCLNKEKPILTKTHNAAIIDFKVVNEYLYSIAQDGYLKKIMLNKTLRIEKSLNLEAIPSALAINFKANKIAVGMFNGDLNIINLNTFKVENTLNLHDNIITKVKFFDNQRLVSSSFDKTMKIYNLKKNNKKELVSCKDYIMTFNFNKQKLLYSCRNGTLVYINLDCNSNEILLKTLSTFE